MYYVIYYVQVSWARSAGNSAIENLCIIIIIWQTYWTTEGTPANLGSQQTKKWLKKTQQKLTVQQNRLSVNSLYIEQKNIWTKEKNTLTVLRFSSLKQGSSRTDCPWILCTWHKNSFHCKYHQLLPRGKDSCWFISANSSHWHLFYKLQFLLIPLSSWTLGLLFVTVNSCFHKKIHATTSKNTAYFFASQCESRDRLDDNNLYYLVNHDN